MSNQYCIMKYLSTSTIYRENKLILEQKLIDLRDMAENICGAEAKEKSQ